MTAADAPDGAFDDRWQQHPANRWAYRNIDQILSVAPIARGDAPVMELNDSARGEVDLDDAFLNASNSDGLLVLKGRDVLAEWYAAGMTPGSRHLLQSVSKSMASCVFAHYVACGDIDVTRPASDYVPELAESAYGEASLREVLDMTVAVRYDETYDDPQSDVQRHDRSANWRTKLTGDPASIPDFLTSLPSTGEHGRRFAYCSANTDVLAWVLESVTGRRYPQLVSERLWSGIGAQADAFITVDATGFSMANGGMCVTLRDLARFGRVVLDGGVGSDGRQVIPSEWIADIRGGNDRSVDMGEIHGAHPTGSYRSQFWLTGDEHGCFYGVGIYGQYVWLNPATDVIVARLATRHKADDDDAWHEDIAFLDAMSTAAG